jgi:DNA polymerase-1
MEREMQVQAVMARITLNGFKVDESLLSSRIQEGVDRKGAAMDVLTNTYGIPGGSKSPLSTKTGKEALIEAFRGAGAPHYPKTATGAIQASREGMDKMMEHYGHFPAVMEICSLVKTVTSERTIYGTIRDHVHHGRVHPDIWPRQASGRWSVTKPGLTVVGKRGKLSVEREVFVPEEGHSIIAIDLGQADMRVVAAHAQDPEYMKLFAPGRDVHSEIATAVFGNPDNGNRFRAKAIGHGAGYGRGAKAISEANSDIPFEVAQQFIDSLRENYPGVAAWQENIRAQGSAGEILDNGFGRPMRVEPDRAYTQAPAQVGQGGTRDLMAEGLLDIARKAPELLPMLRTVVHDEVVLAVPTKDAEEIGRTVVDCMSREWAPEGCSIPVSIIADVSGPGTNWGHAYQV